MLKPSLVHHSCFHDNCTAILPDSFGVLCWNVYKKNSNHPKFKTFLQNKVEKEVVDIILFQEANFCNDKQFELPDFSYNAAANLEFKNKFYGVLTASRVESVNVKAYLSKARESIFGSHKSLLLSSYSFGDGITLLILNVHAINFRENKIYNKEIERFIALIETHKGPMILAGDFNSWNSSRMKKLKKVTEKLSLQSVRFEEIDKVKSFMGKTLDFIFYRELELVESKVVDEHRLSDHNPLFAKFKKK